MIEKEERINQICRAICNIPEYTLPLLAKKSNPLLDHCFKYGIVNDGFERHVITFFTSDILNKYAFRHYGLPETKNNMQITYTYNTFNRIINRKNVRIHIDDMDFEGYSLKEAITKLQDSKYAI